MRPVLGILTLVFLIGGCDEGARDPLQSSAKVERDFKFVHQLTVDGITLTAEGTPSKSEYLSENHRSIQIGDHRIELKDGDLQINNRSYGKFHDGDEIEILEDGTVLVNGEKTNSRPIAGAPEE